MTLEVLTAIAVWCQTDPTPATCRKELSACIVKKDKKFMQEKNHAIGEEMRETLNEWTQNPKHPDFSAILHHSIEDQPLPENDYAAECIEKKFKVVR